MPQITRKTRDCSNVLLILFFMLIAVSGTLSRATAQVNNESDWHVPPPLPPASAMKGVPAIPKSTTGKPVALKLTDIPGVVLPGVVTVQVPALAAIPKSPPLVIVPYQPIALNVITGLDASSPEAPDAPPLSNQPPQDVQFPLTIDLPPPASPDIPAFPAEPTPLGQTKSAHGAIPLLPDMVNGQNLSLPTGSGFTTWATPGIPEDVSVRLETKAKHGRQGTKQKHTKTNY